MGAGRWSFICSRFQFAGAAYLPDVGLHHMRARAYSAATGRFVQADPILHAGGMNLYAYVGADPLNFTDPWGLQITTSRPCRVVTGDDDNPPLRRCESTTSPPWSGQRSVGDFLTSWQARNDPARLLEMLVRPALVTEPDWVAERAGGGGGVGQATGERTDVRKHNSCPQGWDIDLAHIAIEAGAELEFWGALLSAGGLAIAGVGVITSPEGLPAVAGGLIVARGGAGLMETGARHQLFGAGWIAVRGDPRAAINLTVNSWVSRIARIPGAADVLVTGPELEAELNDLEDQIGLPRCGGG